MIEPILNIPLYIFGIMIEIIALSSLLNFIAIRDLYILRRDGKRIGKKYTYTCTRNEDIPK